jgi:hypothetical protein
MLQISLKVYKELPYKFALKRERKRGEVVHHPPRLCGGSMSGFKETTTAIGNFGEKPVLPIVNLQITAMISASCLRPPIPPRNHPDSRLLTRA